MRSKVWRTVLAYIFCAICPAQGNGVRLVLPACNTGIRIGRTVACALSALLRFIGHTATYAGAFPFTLDMTSMTGGTPVSMTPEQVAKLWSDAFELLDHAHHQIGTMLTVVEGSTATLQCYGGALHHRDGVSSGKKTRQYVGTYKFKLVNQDKRWLFNEHKFVLKFIEGNPDLEIDN